ncbi:WD40-repeat-containing domain protein [Suillus discolor]|uniref:WD40-repeat-containing domain protein n=1 Tax=Suillus discolor TaxID=1912936 RepID=A0A9P7JN04_9AGAM|nr:WD40-repeat-containing domain protein [Suillus discolor]KAG2090206.1 WD40-repeat-containing domain protein [Suillus discolor]
MSPEFLATPIIEEAMTSDSEVPAMPAHEEAQDPTQTEKSAPKQEFVGHEDYVWAFVFLHDNIHIVSGSWDGTMRKWDCDTGLLVGQPWTGKGGCIHALALSPDGKTVACGRMDGSVQRWDTDSGKMIEDVWTGHSREVRSLSWSPNGDHIASGSRDGTILIRKLDSGQTEMGPIKTGQRWVNVLVYSPSGDKIASGGLNETICIWDTKTGELVLGPIEELGASVTSLLWSSESKKVYAASDKFVRVFDSNSGIELHRFEHDDLVNSIALSPKHNVLACVGQPGVAQLWDTESYEPLLRQPFIDRQTLRCVAFSRDGRYLASSGLDKKLTLWVVKDMVPELTSPPPSCLDVDVTNPQSSSDVFTDGESDTSYGDCFQTDQPYHPSAPPSGPYRRSRNHNLSPTQRFWNTITVPSRRHLPANESTALQPRPKHSFFAQYTGPQPVTVAVGGNKSRIYVGRLPVKTSTQTGQSSSTITQPTAQPLSMSRPQTQTQVQTTKQQPTPEENYGCWSNFCLAFWCIRRARPVVPTAAQLAAS